MRYAYAITTALIAGGAAATMALQQPVGAQVAQNAPGTIQATPPRAGAPMSFADLAARLQPAVVNISTTQRVQVGTQGGNPFAGTPFEDMFRRFGGQGTDQQGRPITREATSLGSGFIISADGYIVTNNHVISGDPRDPRTQGTVESITVTLPDRREFTARVVGKDQTSDLAVLKIDAQNLPFVQFGDSTRTRVGDWVVAIGNPFALGGTVTAGIVSAIHRSIGQSFGAYDRYIQTDAAINQGNSGGPMFDLQGNVVGINTAIFSPTGGNVGIGFAIPAEQAKPVVEALMKGGKVRRGYLGVGIQPLTDDIANSLGLQKNRGEIVTRVEPGYAAARAGIQQGDVIVKVNGREVTPDETLSYIVANVPVGASIPIELIRNGKTVTVTATVGERPPEDQLAQANSFDDDDDDGTPQQSQGANSTESGIRAALGITVQALTPQIAQQLRMAPTTRGMVVAQVDPSSDAASDLRRGDVIVSINNQPTTTAAAMAQVIAAARAANRPSVVLLVQRGPNPPVYLGVKLAKPGSK